MMAMDPMSQYDPATEALITQQSSPRQRVAQAMMGQQGGGGGMPQLSGLLQQLAMMKAKGGSPAGARPPDPVMGTGYPQMPMDQASSLSYLRPGGR